MLNLVDKSFSTAIVLGLVGILPEENLTEIANLGWKQTPLSKQQIKDYAISDERSGNLQKRITVIVISAAVLITVLIVWISMSIFWNFASKDLPTEENVYFAKQYLIRVTLIFSGYLLFIVYTGVWIVKYYLVYPMNAIAISTNNIMAYAENHSISKEAVDEMQAINLKTNDELEFLYHAICKMAEDSMNQMNDLQYQAKTINQMQTGLIITMADMVENRDKDTGYHIQKTADYVKIIVEGLKKKGYYASKITPKYISDVVLSAPLHDIGKINIPDAILNKPGKLTDEEFAIMKTHAEDGRKIIEKAIKAVQGENYLKEARNMAGYHHEKWDGSGYPEGLKGQVIPLSARIMAVADVFDALSSKRVYKDAMSYEDAIATLQKDAGTHFDPKCVEVFVEAKDEVLKVMEKYKD
ncbi:HD domain-containing protein [Pseudobutyrivibrio sp. OR37]|uniref:HD-GYP domain-containing protein n=1 Tax=Pseudobutyrivibrio sp. OR37 TaxID=1798186 RepID=UPI0008EC8EE3|nr:HD domain-containing phosphohydrolase [Pseudobutyrivibrio sp. OR37]SFH90059.1 HD domain-containing protein [Pseudobutyrivibrio sp. OR37]